MTPALSSAPTRCATRRRAVGQASANPAGAGKWMRSPRRRGGACAPRPCVCRRGFSLALLAATRRYGFAPRLAARFFVDAVDGAQCIARPFPAALKVDPISVAVLVFARSVFGGDSLWFVCHAVCVGCWLGAGGRTPRQELSGQRLPLLAAFEPVAASLRFGNGGLTNGQQISNDESDGKRRVAQAANKRLELVQQVDVGAVDVVDVSVFQHERLAAATINVCNRALGFGRIVAEVDFADGNCVCKRGVVAFDFVVGVCVHNDANLTHLLILSTGFSKFFLGGFYRVNRAEEQKQLGLARLFDTRRGATRLKAGNSMRNVNNQPSDPSPWALMRLLSAAAGLRVFCVYL